MRDGTERKDRNIKKKKAGEIRETFPLSNFNGDEILNTINIDYTFSIALGEKISRNNRR